MRVYWYNPEAAARYLRVSPRTLLNWRTQRRGPRFHKIGGLVRYSRDDLDAFVRGIDPPPAAPVGVPQTA